MAAYKKGTVFKKGSYRGEKLLIDGPAGKLQVQTSYPQNFSPGQPLAVISHPHPVYGGNMTNKVVYNIARAFNEMGYAVIRYNFRGVEQSEGQYDNGIGELEDLEAVTQFFTRRHPDSLITLAGFSFGAYITARAEAVLSPAGVLLVAPPVSMYDFNALTIGAKTWIVIQGGQDEIVDPQQVSLWVENQEPAPDYFYLDHADHFFHGEMEWLRDVITSHWT